MPMFIALGTATEIGRSRTLEGLAERHERAKARAGEAGARVVASYAVLGRFDYLTLLEAPDIETVARVLIREEARGNVHYEILPALPMDQFARLVGEEDVPRPHRLVRSRTRRAADKPGEEGETSRRVSRGRKSNSPGTT